MHIAYLEKIIPTENKYRFYAISISPTLFGSWALIRRWGRINSNGSKLEQWFESEEEAVQKGKQISVQKTRKGYRPFS